MFATAKLIRAEMVVRDKTCRSSRGPEMADANVIIAAVACAAARPTEMIPGDREIVPRCG